MLIKIKLCSADQPDADSAFDRIERLLREASVPVVQRRSARLVVEAVGIAQLENVLGADFPSQGVIAEPVECLSSERVLAEIS